MKNTNQTTFHGKFNKLTSVFHASVLLFVMNFVITLSKKPRIHETIEGKVMYEAIGDNVRWIKERLR